MLKSPYISICIPTYNRLEFLKRLLNTISTQKFRSFEVIITDDSADDVIDSYINNEKFSFPVRYYKNSPSRGTPLNWTEGIQYASGEWIKVIHDDDWLSDENALQHFAEAAKENVDCIFSGFMAFYEDSKKKINNTILQSRFRKISRHPYSLFASNELGPPSVVMFRKSVTDLYDPSLKWLVDIEAYVRILRKYRCVYISKPLIIMSYNNTQVTNACFRNPDIEMHEALIFYRKHGRATHQHIKTYDAWWRLIRNLEIRKTQQLESFSGGENVPDFLKSIVRIQHFIPLKFLKIGAFSKLFMFFFYIVNYIRGFRYHYQL